MCVFVFMFMSKIIYILTSTCNIIIELIHFINKVSLQIKDNLNLNPIFFLAFTFYILLYNIIFHYYNTTVTTDIYKLI